MLAILDSKWQLFIQLAELGSLSRASMTADIPQSVLSRQLAQLERECGTRLFRRTGRGVVLTEFGERLFPRIKAMLAEADLLADDIRTSGGLPSGEVRLGLLPSTVPMLAVRLFEVVRERFPRVRLHLTEGSSAQLEEHVQEGRLDMALVARDLDSERPDEPVLVRHALYLVGRPGDALLRSGEVPFAQIAGLPLVLPSPPHPLRSRLEQLARVHAIQLDMAIDADTMRLQHAIAAAGGGYAITTRPRGPLAAASALITEPTLLRSVVLSTTLRRPHTMATREVHKLLQQWVPGMLNESPTPGR